MVEFDYSLTKKHYVISKSSKKRYYSQLDLLASKEKFNNLIDETVWEEQQKKVS